MVNYFVDTRGWRDRIECKQSRKQILHNVHGYASPGTVTAIMVSWRPLLVQLSQICAGPIWEWKDHAAQRNRRQNREWEAIWS